MNGKEANSAAEPRLVPAVSPWDDYFIHQTTMPMAIVQTPDPRWTDRMYFNVHDTGGRVLLGIGFGSYRNTGVMDAIVYVVYQGRQITLRLSRSMGPTDYWETAIGPLRANVVEPLKRWSWQLDPNDSPVSFSLDFQARHAPYLYKKFLFQETTDSPTDFTHYVQMGSASGTITVNGVTLELAPFLALRDRSWGLRPAREKQGLHLWLQHQFSAFSISLIHNENRDNTVAYSDGAIIHDGGEVVTIVDVRHRIEFDPGTREPCAAKIAVSDASGREYSFKVRRLSKGYPAGVGYGGWAGVQRGALYHDWEEWDLSDPAILDRIPLLLFDQLAELEMDGEKTVGSFQAGLSRSCQYQYRPRW